MIYEISGHVKFRVDFEIEARSEAHAERLALDKIKGILPNLYLSNIDSYDVYAEEIESDDSIDSDVS
jgi:hypothetical protein